MILGDIISTKKCAFRLYKIEEKFVMNMTCVSCIAHKVKKCIFHLLLSHS